MKYCMLLLLVLKFCKLKGSDKEKQVQGVENLKLTQDRKIPFNMKSMKGRTHFIQKFRSRQQNKMKQQSQRSKARQNHRSVQTKEEEVASCEASQIHSSILPQDAQMNMEEFYYHTIEFILPEMVCIRRKEKVVLTVDPLEMMTNLLPNNKYTSVYFKVLGTLITDTLTYAEWFVKAMAISLRKAEVRAKKHELGRKNIRLITERNKHKLLPRRANAKNKAKSGKLNFSNYKKQKRKNWYRDSRKQRTKQKSRRIKRGKRSKDTTSTLCPTKSPISEKDVISNAFCENSIVNKAITINLDKLIENLFTLRDICFHCHSLFYWTELGYNTTLKDPTFDKLYSQKPECSDFCWTDLKSAIENEVDNIIDAAEASVIVNEDTLTSETFTTSTTTSTFTSSTTSITSTIHTSTSWTSTTSSSVPTHTTKAVKHTTPKPSKIHSHLSEGL